MLGHALGVSIDIHATQNPNIRLPKETGVRNYEYLIARAGADASGRPGRAMMNLDDAGFGSADRMIEALGNATVAGQDTRHAPIVEKIRTQFAEMVASSERLQRSIEASLPKLRETRALYFQWLKNKAELAVHEKRRDLSPAELLKLETQANSHRFLIGIKLKDAFHPWLKMIEEHAALDLAALAFEEFLLEAQDRKLAEIGAVDPKAPDALAKLNAMDTRWQLTAASHVTRPTQAALLKGLLLKRAREQRAAIPSGRNVYGSKEYLSAELAVLDHWKTLLSEPALVFGAPNRQIDVQDIPVMQLIERGFIESGPPMRTTQQGQKITDVFNAEVAATLARHGFAPGATFGDTMHFDLIEGYNAVPGGRSSANLAPDRFGPLGVHGAPAEKP